MKPHRKGELFDPDQIALTKRLATLRQTRGGGKRPAVFACAAQPVLPESRGTFWPDSFDICHHHNIAGGVVHEASTYCDDSDRAGRASLCAGEVGDVSLIQIGENSATLTPFGSLIRITATRARVAKPWLARLSAVLALLFR
jgi:hypothetical protein